MSVVKFSPKAENLDDEDVKKRIWSAVLYPDSLPNDWKNILEFTGLKIAISPLHDKDVWTKDDELKNHEYKAGALKKPHYHAILIYQNPTTFKNVKKLMDKLNAPKPKSIERPVRAYEYLSHKNAPEKAQYDEKDICLLNGFSIAPFLSAEEISEHKKQIRKIIREKDILEYSDLLDYFDDAGEGLLAKIADTHTIFFNAYITSRRHKRKGKLQKNENSTPKTAADVMKLTANALGDEPSEALY